MCTDIIVQLIPASEATFGNVVRHKRIAWTNEAITNVTKQNKKIMEHLCVTKCRLIPNSFSKDTFTKSNSSYTPEDALPLAVYHDSQYANGSGVSSSGIRGSLFKGTNHAAINDFVKRFVMFDNCRETTSSTTCWYCRDCKIKHPVRYMIAYIIFWNIRWHMMAHYI